MDKVIQGQTQSAIVQKLSETEHNLKRFTKDIPDNAPYRAVQKRVLNPYTPYAEAPSSEIRFRVPRHGHLIRMYMRAKLFCNATPEVAEFGSPQGNDLARDFDASFFASFLTSVHLMIGNKELEVLYPENILSRANELAGAESESVLMGLRGRFSNNDLGEFSFDVQNGKGNPNVGKYVNFLIPLDFSLLKFHKDALDTRFMNEIELVVKKRPIRLYQTQSSSYTKCEIVCKYSVYHEHFYTQLRNVNHGEETVTKIINSNYIVPEETYEEKEKLEYPGPGDIIPSTDGSASTRFLPQFPTSNASNQFQQGFGQTVDQSLTRIYVEKLTGVKFAKPIVETEPGEIDTRLKLKNISDYESGVYFQNFNTVINRMDLGSVALFNNLVNGDSITFHPDVVPESSGLAGTWSVTKQVSPVISLDGYSPPPGADTDYQGEMIIREVVSVVTVNFGCYRYNLSKLGGMLDEILITFRNKELDNLDSMYGEVESAPLKNDYLKFTITINGEKVFDKFHHEMRLEKHNISSLDIQDQSFPQQSSKMFGLENTGNEVVGIDPLYFDGSKLRQNNVVHKHSANMYRISLSMFDTDEFLNGGLDMNTANVELTIEGGMLSKKGNVGTNSEALIGPCIPQVVLQSKSLCRIDGKTGSVVKI